MALSGMITGLLLQRSVQAGQCVLPRISAEGHGAARPTVLDPARVRNA
jgi:hypothetical protein